MLSSPDRSLGQSVNSNPVISRFLSGRRSNKMYFFIATFIIFMLCTLNIIRLHTQVVTTSDRSLRYSDTTNKRIVVANDTPQHIGVDNNDRTNQHHKPTIEGEHKRIEASIQPKKKEGKKRYNKQSRRRTHPRIACLISNIDDDTNSGTSCNYLGDTFTIKPRIKHGKWLTSIPLIEELPKGHDKDEDEEKDVNEYIETDTCKFPQDSKAKAVGQSTCNDIHSLGFDVHMFSQKAQSSNHPRMSIKYITMGGAKAIWKVYDNQETYIFKTHKQSHFFKRKFFDQSEKDSLISGGMGNMQLSTMIESTRRKGRFDIPSDYNHILPMYSYCGLASIVPFAHGTLEEWITRYDTEKTGERPDPMDKLHLALQAARGIHQAQMHWNGRATFVHADLNPSQFLVFLPHGNKKNMPLLMINDFNQGRFLTRSITNNNETTCPFRSCSKNQRGNRYHSPERFQNCVDQDEGIDTFTLGSVLFYLITCFEPYYDNRNYYPPIKKGEVPHIPKRLNLDHPAYVALIDVMKRCMTAKLTDRPKTIEVVHMLEEKVKQIGNS